MSHVACRTLVAAGLGLALALPAAAQVVDLVKIGAFDSGLGEGASEISAYDAGSRRLFVVNSVQAKVDILDLSNPAAPAKVGAIDVTPYGAVANSVDTYNGLVAVAVQAEPKTDPGKILFFNTQGVLQKQVPAGALPDMVTFSPNGKYVLAANEGEPSDDYTVDPEGSVTLIDLSGGLAAATVFSFRFDDFNLGGPRAAELPPAVRIYGPNASVAKDLEPEYIAVSADESRAWVTLQENNAMAMLDLAGRRVEGIAALGFKNHQLAANKLDPSDRDNGTHLANWPVFGTYLPDAIAAYRVNGETLLVTANEGDARAWSGYSEETRIGDLNLDPQAFANGAALQEDAALGRLRTSTALGDVDGDGDYDRVYSFGARSLSIWRGDVGSLVADSGGSLEQAVAAAGGFVDNRSDDKGPEPEGLAIGDVDGRHYAFLGLERSGGVAVYDITTPTTPTLAHYEKGEAADESPEGIEFIPGAASPNGKPLLVLAHEVSGTVAIYEIKTRQPGAGNCTPDGSTLCLNNGRFQVTAHYRTQRGDVGFGHAEGITGDSGYFYFFDEGNVEVVVKVLDACQVYGKYWVFASGLTNLEVEIVVTDTANGTKKTYTNPLFVPFAPVLDLSTFATCP
jgi:2',3'-cyclic-nucleotide 2'-phosphodiesterase/3'-nucleotidase/5'-nucleotidase